MSICFKTKNQILPVLIEDDIYFQLHNPKCPILIRYVSQERGLSYLEIQRSSLQYSPLLYIKTSVCMQRNNQIYIYESPSYTDGICILMENSRGIDLPLQSFFEMIETRFHTRSCFDITDIAVEIFSRKIYWIASWN